jgi:uncharacterized protein (TIGR03083 family)
MLLDGAATLTDGSVRSLRGARTLCERSSVESNNGGRYVAAKARVVELVARLDDDYRIAATPAWSLRDLLVHLVGVADDVACGRVDGYATPDWTHTQVLRGAGLSRESVLSDWDDAAARVAPVLDDPVGHGLDATFGVLPLIDVLAHEQDIREADGAVGAVDPPEWDVVSTRRRDVLQINITTANLPALRVKTIEGDNWAIGPGEPSATVRAPRYELWRSLEGRRSRNVVRDFEWSTTPDPYLSAWLGPVFAWPEDQIG